MTAVVVVDPAEAIAAAAEQLREELRELLDSCDPADLIGKVRKALSRASRKAGKAQRAAKPPVPKVLAEPTKAAAQPAPTPTAAPAGPLVVVPTRIPPRAVTLTLPKATPVRPRAHSERPVTTGGRMSQPVDPASPRPSPPRKTRRWPLFVVLGVLGFVALLAVALNTTDAGSGDDADQSTMAKIQCEDFVKDRLKSPASAEFSSQKVDRRPGQTADFYTVIGTVDSQNSFGAMLRNTYTCELTAERDGTWRLNDLDFADR